MHRLYTHLRRMKALNVNVSLLQVFQNPYLWLEFCVIAPHCPPFFTSSFGIENMQNWSAYRAETIGACYNILRCYTLWRFFCDMIIRNLPKRHTIGNFTGIKFDSSWVVKHLLDGWSGVWMIVGLWSFCILALGYFFRAAEQTACLLQFTDHPDCLTRKGLEITWDYGQSWETRDKDTFPFNGFWMMFVTSTTIGYGDVAVTTHLGRAACILMGIIGTCFASILTACLSNVLCWTPIESTSLMVLEREKDRQEVRALAADRIVYWWRQRQKRLHRDRPPEWKFFWLVKKIRDTFRHYRNLKNRELSLVAMHRKCSVEIDDLTSEARKMDLIYAKVKYLSAGLCSMKDDVRNMVVKEAERLEKEQVHPSLLSLEENDVILDTKFKEKTEAKILMEMRRVEAEAKLGGLSKSNRKLSKRRSIHLSAEAEAKIWGKICFIDSPAFAWHRTIANIQERKSLRCRQAGLFGVLGTMFAMGQNEWLMTGGRPSDGVMFFLKASNTMLTVICIICILRAYYLAAISKRLHLHVHHLRDMNLEKVGYGWIWDPALCMELLILAIHNPPFLSRSFIMEDMGPNIYVLRSETMMASFNMVRLYLIWRVIRDWMVDDLPKRFTLAGFQRLKIGTSFAIKRMLNSWYAIVYLALAWFAILFLLAYWFRAVEITACQLPGIPAEEMHERCLEQGATEWGIGRNAFTKVNDYYMYNAIWFMIVTSTSVGYGDVVPTTSLGRMVASFSGVVGLVFMSLLTASMANQLQWSPGEASANVILKREVSRLKRREIAAFMIQVWYRRRCRFRAAGAAKKEKITNMKHLLLALRHICVCECGVCVRSCL